MICAPLSVGLVRHKFRQGESIASLAMSLDIPKEDVQAVLREAFKLKREFLRDWKNKPAKCATCRTDKSTKYRIGDVRYCNLCILVA